jgi:hypothetical protein
MSSIPVRKLEIERDEGYRSMGAVFQVYIDRGGGLAEGTHHKCFEIALGA